MKKVKEYLSEKFEEETDPISDMNIGGISFGVLRSEMKKRFENNFNNKIRHLLLGKTITGTFNEQIILKKNARNNIIGTIGNGRGWGKYTIKVDRIQVNINEPGILVYSDTSPYEIRSYIIPFDENKVYISK